VVNQGESAVCGPLDWCSLKTPAPSFVQISASLVQAAQPPKPTSACHTPPIRVRRSPGSRRIASHDTGGCLRKREPTRCSLHGTRAARPGARRCSHRPRPHPYTGPGTGSVEPETAAARAQVRARSISEGSNEGGGARISTRVRTGLREPGLRLGGWTLDGDAERRSYLQGLSENRRGVLLQQRRAGRLRLRGPDTACGPWRGAPC
jgi:hypothetical protein